MRRTRDGSAPGREASRRVQWASEIHIYLPLQSPTIVQYEFGSSTLMFIFRTRISVRLVTVTTARTVDRETLRISLESRITATIISYSRFSRIQPALQRRIIVVATGERVLFIVRRCGKCANPRAKLGATGVASLRVTMKLPARHATRRDATHRPPQPS